MIKYTYIHIVLVYRNHVDLEIFMKNIKSLDFKVIVVNSFYDNTSRTLIEDIAVENNADFINIPNKGYGFGNDLGIKYALDNYDFDFLIINNADVEVLKFDYEKVKLYSKQFIYAPQIKTIKLKDQNPFIISYSKLFRFLYYTGCKKRSRILKLSTIIINGLVRRIFNFFVKIFRLNYLRIYSCHGSFFLIGKEAVVKLYPLYLHQMFLFQEEHFLARKAFLNSVKIYYVPSDIQIKHYEDGSVDFSNGVLNRYQDESYIMYYEFFNKQ